MIHVLNIALVISIGVSMAMLVYWGTGLSRTISLSRTIPTAAHGLDLDPCDDQSVCIVVPAHNEADNIVELIRSIRAQSHQRWRLILALDRCTDDTARLAAEAIDDDDRIEILEITECPADWAGKVNALWHGVNHAEAAASCDVLLFVDADTALHADCLRATLALKRARSLDLLSLVPNVNARRWWEWVAQPAAGLELIRQYPLARSNRDGYARPFVNGQFIMINREAYNAIGGHQAVFDEMLEDLAIGRLAASKGLRSGAFLAGGMLVCRMYDSWPQFTCGWLRIFAEASRRRVRRLGRASVQVRVFGTVLPLITAAGFGVSMLAIGRSPMGFWIPAAILTTAGLTCYIATLRGAFRPVGLPWGAVASYPIGAWLVGGVLRGAAGKVERREMTSWAGREYRLSPR